MSDDRTMSRSDVTVRPARPDDRDFVLGLVPRLHDFVLPPWRTAAQLDRSERDELTRAFDAIDGGALPADEMLIVAELAGRRAGFLHALTRADFFEQRPAGHVSTIVVAPEAEGRGVGRALLDAAESWARSRGYPTLGLNVFERNARARAAYERSGFALETLRYVKRLRVEP